MEEAQTVPRTEADQGHDIIVIAASAGGVEAVGAVVESLPADLPAAVFVVVHIPPYATSVLPVILARRGALPAVHPEDGAPIELGTVCVAPPDRHLLLERDRVRLTRGPRENGHRPAADTLFRSAARAYGGRVVGVVLSGTLDDGTAGLMAVRRGGGITVVQDPETAYFSGMPASAVAAGVADHVLPLEQIAPLLVRLVATPAPPARPAPDAELSLEVDIAAMEPYALEADRRPGTPSGYSCPDCQGTLWEIHEGSLVRFRCRVGHAFGAETLMAEQSESVETALWTAFQTLRERAALARGMAARMEDRGSVHSARRFTEQAAEADHRARVIERVLRGAAGPSRDGGNGPGAGPGVLPGERVAGDAD